MNVKINFEKLNFPGASKAIMGPNLRLKKVANSVTPIHLKFKE